MTEQATPTDGPATTPAPNPNTERTPYLPIGKRPVRSQEEWLQDRKAQRREAAQSQPVEAPSAQSAPSAQPQAKEATEPSPTEPETEPDPVEPTAEPTQDPESQPEPVEAGEGQDSEGADVQTDAQPEYFPETLPELIEALGVESDDFMQGLTAKVVHNGETLDVSLDDLVKSYSSKAERDRIAQTLVEQQKAETARAEQRETEWNNRIKEAEQYLAVVQASLQSGPSDAELAQLASTDEVAYLKAIANRDAQQRQLQAILAQRQEMVNKWETEQSNKHTAYRQSQYEAVKTWKPELADPGKFAAFETRLREGLTSKYGLTHDDVNAFFLGYTAKQVEILDDALKYRDMKAKEAPLRQKLAKTPKLTPPGPRRTERQSANDKVLSARNRLKASGTKEDAIGFLRARRAQRNLRHGGSQ